MRFHTTSAKSCRSRILILKTAAQQRRAVETDCLAWGSTAASMRTGLHEQRAQHLPLAPGGASRCPFPQGTYVGPQIEAHLAEGPRHAELEHATLETLVARGELRTTVGILRFEQHSLKNPQLAVETIDTSLHLPSVDFRQQ